jgi:UDP-N-acetyl-D-mannosaminuronic acid transferase (WecB/TagA/CpsF family)
MRDRVSVPLLAVGAAFDFHAGLAREAPAWMQRWGLQWLQRLAGNPRRLWKRYLILNPLYLTLLGAQALRIWRPKIAVSAARKPDSREMSIPG